MTARGAPAPGLIVVLAPVFAILLGCASFEIGAGIVGPLVTVQLIGRESATWLIGVVSSSYFAGFIVGTLTCGRLIERAGHIRALCVFSVAAANATLLFALTESPYAWMAWRAFLGFAMAGIFVIIESWLNEKATTATRGKLLAAYQVIGWSTGGLAPFALNLTDSMAPTLFVVAAICFASALVPVALSRTGDPGIGQRSRLGLRDLFAASPVGVVVCFGSGLINSALFGLLPVYTAGQGMTTGELTVVLGVATLGGLLAQVPAGMLSDRLGRRPVILMGIGVAIAATAVVLALGKVSFPMAMVIAFAFAFGAGPLYSMGMAQTNDRVDPRQMVAASGGLLCAWAVGAVFGAAIASQTMDAMGPQGLFVFEAVVLTLLAGFTLFRMMRRPGETSRAAVDKP